MDKRLEQLKQWLVTVLPDGEFSLTSASSDASFRRYFRVHLSDQALIVMDAPPEKERCEPFANVAEHLHRLGLNVPQIFAKNFEQGLMLLGDLGSETYLDVLNQDNASVLYPDALEALVKMQAAQALADLPAYDEALLKQEMNLFTDWYLAKHLQYQTSETEKKVIDNTFDLLAKQALGQTQVMVHRDFHSRNLMRTEENNPGILDFQDAVIGPATYDLVSLLRDAYISWDEPLVIDWAVRYWDQAKAAGLALPQDFSAFYRDFEWMGAQRHIKILGIFARLNYRDGKSNYLNDMPLVMEYLKQVCERYLALKPFFNLLNSIEAAQQ